LFIASLSFAQITFLKQPYDYGLINGNNQYVDIPIKNTSDKKVFIFRADADKRFQIHYSSKTILPDSTVYVRIQFTPTKKGAFSEKIPIHFSCYNEPKAIKITGYVEEIPNNSIACPSFNQVNVNDATNFDFTVKVIDKETKESIEKTNVLMIKNGIVTQNLFTNKKGTIKKKVDLGFYYFVVKKEGYATEEFTKYINKQNNHVLVELQRTQKPIENNQEEEVIVQVEEEKQITPPLPQQDSALTISNSEEKYPNFPLSKYKPNNIVFLIDVSSSMKYTGKLDLLKASMIEMTNLLRDVDNITIVTYASNTIVAMETMSADNKKAIIEKIESLEAKGLTNGGKGLKLAYSKACESYIAHGNNEIIMATDGDFNSGKENVYKLAKKYKNKGVKISVIGIKNRKEHEENMKKVALNGGGNYIKIDNFEDAKKRLVEEVMVSSRLQ